MIDIFNGAYGKITSAFGLRDSPTAGASTNHKGVDIVLYNPAIPNVSAGTVTASGFNSSMGNYVTVKDADGYKYTYMHMANLPTLTTGQTVKEGDIIGTMGSTGISTGAHLHLGIQKDGAYVDPVSLLSSSTKSVTNSLPNWDNPTSPVHSQGPGAKEVFSDGINQVKDWATGGLNTAYVNMATIALLVLLGFLAYKFFMQTFKGTQAMTLVKEGG